MNTFGSIPRIHRLLAESGVVAVAIAVPHRHARHYVRVSGSGAQMSEGMLYGIVLGSFH